MDERCTVLVLSLVGAIVLWRVATTRREYYTATPLLNVRGDHNVTTGDVTTADVHSAFAPWRTRRDALSTAAGTWEADLAALEEVASQKGMQVALTARDGRLRLKVPNLTDTSVHLSAALVDSLAAVPAVIEYRLYDVYAYGNSTDRGGGKAAVLHGPARGQPRMEYFTTMHWFPELPKRSAVTWAGWNTQKRPWARFVAGVNVLRNPPVEAEHAALMDHFFSGSWKAIIRYKPVDGTRYVDLVVPPLSWVDLTPAFTNGPSRHGRGDHRGILSFALMWP